MGRNSVSVPNDVKEQMIRDQRLGTSVINISKIYGYSIRATRRALGECGVDLKRGRKKSADKLKYESMKQDYLNGFSIKKIALKYDVEIETVYLVFRRLGFSLKQHQGKNKAVAIEKDIELGELSQSEIARKHECSRQYVLQVKKRMENGSETLEF